MRIYIKNHFETWSYLWTFHKKVSLSKEAFIFANSDKYFGLYCTVLPWSFFGLIFNIILCMLNYTSHTPSASLLDSKTGAHSKGWWAALTINSLLQRYFPQLFILKERASICKVIEMWALREYVKAKKKWK